MLTVLDMMEASMQAEAKMRKASTEYMQQFTAPLQKAAQVKQMLAAGAPSPNEKPDNLQLARRAAALARGERRE